MDCSWTSSKQTSIGRWFESGSKDIFSNFDNIAGQHRTFDSDVYPESASSRHTAEDELAATEEAVLARGSAESELAPGEVETNVDGVADQRLRQEALGRHAEGDDDASEQKAGHNGAAAGGGAERQRRLQGRRV